MTLTDYIEAGAKKAESVAELARIIGTTREHASAAKSMRKPLPLDCAVKLANYIGAEKMAVIAANELATEKKEEKRAFWSSFLVEPAGGSYIRHIVKWLRNRRTYQGLGRHPAAC